MTSTTEPEVPVTLAPGEPSPSSALARRQRFRAAIRELSERSSSQDLVRWVLVPGSVAVVLGFIAMVLGWVGAARTAREIEQIPYLISGGLIGLALVVLGGLLLVSAFWVAVLRKLHDEAEARSATGLAELQARIAELEATRPAPRRAKRAPRTSTSRRAPAEHVTS
ncbi:MAG: hypothetical protein ACLGI8_05020 [Acidimicrobiia bacterium]|jgi:hypothetical protein